MAVSLLIETCTEKGCIALLEENRLLYHADLPFGVNNSQSLVPAIYKGMQSVGVESQSLSYISIGAGPGSYTGMRVGAVVAKSFAFVLNIPLVAFSSLECYVPSRDGKFAAVIDAKIGGVYFLLGDRLETELQHASVPQMLSLEAAAAIFKEYGIVSIVSPHAASLAAKFGSISDERWEWTELSPDINHLRELVWEKYSSGKTLGPDQLELLYLRKTQAEIERGL